MGGSGTTPYNVYHRNVFGLGRDSALDQRIATNINDSGPSGTFPLDILTMATGALSAPSQYVYTHQASGAALTQGQYLMVGNNAGSTATVTPAAVANAAVLTINGNWSRLTRQWRAQNTGSVGTVSVLFNVPAAGVTALGGDLSKVVLLVDDDGNYANGGTRIVTDGRSVSGNQISFNVTLANAEIFTLAFTTATIRLDKTTVSTSGTYTFNVTNTAPVSGSVAVAANATQSVDTNAGTAGVQPFGITDINQDVTVTEAALPANVKLSALSCVNNATGGTTFSPTYDLTARTATIPAASVHAGAVFVCTFTNSAFVSNLNVTKTNTPGINGNADQAADTVTKGATTTYTLTVTNNGPDTVTGAVVTDPAGVRVGLTCTTPPTCTGTACPAGPLTVANLEKADLPWGPWRTANRWR